MDNLEFLKEGFNLMITQSEKIETAVKTRDTKAAMTAILLAFVAVAEKVKHQAAFVDGEMDLSGDGKGNETAGINTQLKVDFKNIPNKGKENKPAFQGKSDEKGKADMATTKSDATTKTSVISTGDKTELVDSTEKVEDKGEDSAAVSTDTTNSSVEDVASIQTETSVAGDTEEDIANAETEKDNTAEETTAVIDDHAKDRLSLEDAHVAVKIFIEESFAKGGRGNNKKDRIPVNAFIMHTFPVIEEEAKDTKEGNIKRNKMQDVIWREITAEAKKKIVEKDDKVIQQASDAVKNLLDSAKGVFVKNEPAKIPTSIDPEKVKTVTAEEIQTGKSTDEAKTVEVKESAKDEAVNEVNDLLNIAQETAVEEVTETTVEEPKINLATVDLGLFVETMKNSLTSVSDEDLDNNKELFQKWVDLMNKRSSMPDSVNLVGLKAPVIIRRMFDTIKKQNAIKKAA